MDSRSSLALATVGADVIRATEDLEGRVTLNTVLLAEVGLLGAVDLCELDVLLLEGGGGLLVLGGEGLAVTTPGSEDWEQSQLLVVPPSEAGVGLGQGRERLTLGEDEVVGLDEVAKGVLGQLMDVGVALSRDHAGEGRQQAVAESLVLHVWEWGRGSKGRRRRDNSNSSSLAKQSRLPICQCS